MLVAELITFSAAFARYDGLHSVAICDGVPLVWNDGVSVVCEAVSIPIEIARIVRSFKKKWWAEYQHFWVTTLRLVFGPVPLG